MKSFTKLSCIGALTLSLLGCEKKRAESERTTFNVNEVVGHSAYQYKDITVYGKLENAVYDGKNVRFNLQGEDVDDDLIVPTGDVTIVIPGKRAGALLHCETAVLNEDARNNLEKVLQEYQGRLVSVTGYIGAKDFTPYRLKTSGPTIEFLAAEKE